MFNNIIVKCTDCGEESILQNELPDSWMPFCPHCNKLVFISQDDMKEMFKKEDSNVKRN
jgi:endogenous inhibitor of DNA gyrase (YacG/DUF329 family)